MEAPTIKVLTPCYMGQVNVEYTTSLLDFFAYSIKTGISWSLETLPNCSLISLGRSMMLNKALKDKSWTHAMWIDADIVFRPEYIHSMILDDKDIVGGLYPKKEFPINFASSPVPSGEETESLYETLHVATGFMLIKREVVEKMNEHYKEELSTNYQGNKSFVHLFHPIIDRDNNDLYLSEDFAFCKRATDIGFKCFVTRRFTLSHIGVSNFSLENEFNILKTYEKQEKIKLINLARGEDQS